VSTIPATSTRTAQAVYREGERLMVWTVLRDGGGPLIAIGLVAMVAAAIAGIFRLVRAGC